MRVDGILIASFYPDNLACTKRVIRRIASFDCLLEQRGGICVDDDCSPGFLVENFLTDIHGVVGEVLWRNCFVSKVRFGGRQPLLCGLHNERTYLGNHGRIWCHAVEVNHKDGEGRYILIDVGQDSPVHRQNPKNENRKDQGWQNQQPIAHLH